MYKTVSHILMIHTTQSLPTFATTSVQKGQATIVVKRLQYVVICQQWIIFVSCKAWDLLAAKVLPEPLVIFYQMTT